MTDLSEILHYEPATPGDADSTPDTGLRPDVQVAGEAPLLRLLAASEIDPTATRRASSFYVRVLKAGFDRLLAAGALVVLAVPMAVIAGVVRATMGKPVLFRQRRIGRGGRPFMVLKFRTMRPDRRQAHRVVPADRRRTHKSDDDPRHTSVGRFLRKWSLDELPQLINVVRGEMSLIGPRPELESVVAAYSDSELHGRHLVKPGLTGLWQISARGDGPMHENGDFDLEYVRTVSLATDLRILVRTPKAMLGSNHGH
jgi:lipopolysaccharide/colanic/teichoic acid biosynthesis glycosyltransferase